LQLYSLSALRREQCGSRTRKAKKLNRQEEITTPNQAWMMQMGRTLTDAFDGFLLHKRFIILDRDRKFCELHIRAIEYSDTTGARGDRRFGEKDSNRSRGASVFNPSPPVV
jgi:hypothetical protein